MNARRLAELTDGAAGLEAGRLRADLPPSRLLAASASLAEAEGVGGKVGASVRQLAIGHNN
jgi:hypothetical protein